MSILDFFREYDIGTIIYYYNLYGKIDNIFCSEMTIWCRTPMSKPTVSVYSEINTIKQHNNIVSFFSPNLYPSIIAEMAPVRRDQCSAVGPYAVRPCVRKFHGTIKFIIQLFKIIIALLKMIINNLFQND